MPYKTYPQSATNAAKKALKHKEDNGSKCGTSVGWNRARQLANRAELSEDEVIRTFSFLSRAKVYDQGKYFDENENEICGSIMYDAWGGSTMLPWAEKTANKIMEDRSNNNQMERRYFNIEFKSDIETREITGIASSLNRAYDMGSFDEEIDMDAFNDADFSEAAALFNHDQNIVLGRVKNNTLVIKRDGNALVYNIFPPETHAAEDVMKLIKRGDIYQSSFAFSLMENGDRWEMKDGRMKRTITKINKVYDVSPVTYPANPNTTVASRSMERHIQQNEKAECNFNEFVEFLNNLKKY
jgi:HK97 family phage prohead protease